MRRHVQSIRWAMRQRSGRWDAGLFALVGVGAFGWTTGRAVWARAGASTLPRWEAAVVTSCCGHSGPCGAYCIARVGDIAAEDRDSGLPWDQERSRPQVGQSCRPLPVCALPRAAGRQSVPDR
jgi:hypothetical protein